MTKVVDCNDKSAYRHCEESFGFAQDDEAILLLRLLLYFPKVKAPKSVANLIEAFESLPGIGPKTAARLTYYLLQAPDTLARQLSDAARDLKTKTKICSICQNITETDPCEICDDPQRDKSIICIVEDPLDVWAIELSQTKYCSASAMLLQSVNITHSYRIVTPEMYRSPQTVEEN